MNLDDYQARALVTAVDPTVTLVVEDKHGNNHLYGGDWVYVTLGLGSEVGELQGVLKKVLRDQGGWIGPEAMASLKAELGDVLWYVAAVASRLGLSLDVVAEANLAKLADRQRRGVVGGSGDKR